jgi:hypothetical protein
MEMSAVKPDILRTRGASPDRHYHYKATNDALHQLMAAHLPILAGTDTMPQGQVGAFGLTDRGHIRSGSARTFCSSMEILRRTFWRLATSSTSGRRAYVSIERDDSPVRTRRLPVLVVGV